MVSKKLQNFSNSDIEKVTNRIIEKINNNKLFEYRNNEELLRALVKYLGGNISINSLYQESEHLGSLIVDSERNFEIKLSPYTTPLQDNFTIAHELGHLFLHVEFDDKSSDNEPNSIFFTRSGSGQYEIEADRFAMSLLMPQEKMKEAIEKYERNVYFIAGHFKVSVQETMRRLHEFE